MGDCFEIYPRILSVKFDKHGAERRTAVHRNESPTEHTQFDETAVLFYYARKKKIVIGPITLVICLQ
jgi:hypothetical protein